MLIVAARLETIVSVPVSSHLNSKLGIPIMLFSKPDSGGN
jgi:hypothetical protein